MKPWVLTIAFATLAAGALTAEAAGLRQPIREAIAVDVYMRSNNTMWRPISQAKRVVSEIFTAIGVNLAWHIGLPPAEQDSSNAAGRPAFSIRWVERAPESAAAGALASSHPYCSHDAAITFYEDRIQRWLEQHPDVQSVALAYVLAHELAHVMQGVARHSDSGIMKAHWPNADIYRMSSRRLAFTDHDVELIRNGLEGRTSGRLTMSPVDTR